MNWTRLDPGAGDVSAIRSMATARTNESEQLRESARDGILSAGDLVEGWHGESAAAFATRLAKVDAAVGQLAGVYGDHARALLGYASAVEQIAQDAAALRVRIAQNDEDLRILSLRLDAIDSDPTAALQQQLLTSEVQSARSELSSTEHERDALASRRLAADTAFVDAISSGHGTASSDTQYTPNALYTDDEFMSILAGMTGAQVLALLSSDASFAARLAAVQDAEGVAQWWQSLAPEVGDNAYPEPSDIQLQLLEEHPTVFGNLDGIWYTHRDIANRTAWKADYHEMQDLLAEYYTLVGTPGSYGYSSNPGEDFLAAHGFTVGSLLDAIDESEAIRETLAAAGNPDDGGYVYQLVLYQPGDPMMAAVSVGNVDMATQVTTAVPGMGSTITKSLHEWTLNAQNIYDEQLAIGAPGEGGMAVVAWIGYDAPEMAGDFSNSIPQQLEVVSSESAKNGAPNLVDFLEGVTATQGWDAGQNLSVIAHSYGTTVASLALTETPVEHFIMLGSAGIDESIPDVSHLQVDPDNVWASEAHGDNIADLGQGDVQIGGPGGYLTVPVDVVAPIVSPIVGLVSPLLGTVLAPAIWSIDFQHTIDPTSDAYGANVFSSEDAVAADGSVLHGSDWHSSSPQIEADLTGKPTDQYGYLDANTNPLHNSALLSLGITDGVTVPPGGGGSTGNGSSGGGGNGGGGGGR